MDAITYRAYYADSWRFVVHNSQSKNEWKSAEQRADFERLATQQREKVDTKTALNNQREAALQLYLDRISKLLLKQGLLSSRPEDEVRIVARVRTLTVLGQLDPTRKNAVLSFLREAHLFADDDKSIISFSEANLSNVDMENVDLSYIDLLGAHLENASLKDAKLEHTSLEYSYLQGANLEEANLNNASLIEAQLKYA